ncbi:helix-turn-helix domain-containing protein [Desulfacinum hydrothermale]|uniref:helix-turn-helix domain-containing protein n=1 Tax=Desulfacinum hydrothermale TaxID=109258 RepID=UPI003CCBB1AA
MDIPHIAEAVCANFGARMEELRFRASHKKISEARQVAMYVCGYLCREYTSQSVHPIPKASGAKPHPGHLRTDPLC